MLVIQPVYASKVGDAAFGAHARAAEKNDVVALFNPVSEDFDLFIHRLTLL